jgi:hypothetical protein
MSTGRTNLQINGADVVKEAILWWRKSFLEGMLLSAASMMDERNWTGSVSSGQLSWWQSDTTSLHKRNYFTFVSLRLCNGKRSRANDLDSVPYNSTNTGQIVDEIMWLQRPV